MVLTSSSVILMEEAQPSPSTQVGIYRHSCCVGSQKTPALPSVSFSNINKSFRIPNEISQCEQIRTPSKSTINRLYRAIENSSDRGLRPATWGWRNPTEYQELSAVISGALGGNPDRLRFRLYRAWCKARFPSSSHMGELLIGVWLFRAFIPMVYIMERSCSGDRRTPPPARHVVPCP